MTDFQLGLFSFPLLLALIFARMPIGLAMFVIGLGGAIWITGGWAVVLARLKTETYGIFANYSFSIVPLFLLMGQFATLGGISRSLFKAAEVWLGHRKGGIGMAAIGACAGFGSICGSSLATAATMSQVALPEMKRYGYGGGLSSATLAAGGTLGILIPPSIILVIYAILTEQNIAKLFLAAFVPGFLAALGYMVTISLLARFGSDSIQTRAPVPYRARFAALWDIWPVLLVFFLVIGGIYLGWFTPTEAAAIGALGTGLIAFFTGGLTAQTLTQAVLATAKNSAMIFVIILGAAFYNSFLALSQVPQEVSEFVISQGFNPWLILILILGLYLVFGCIMDSLSMILLTVPIFFPIVSVLDFGLSAEETALWFGILVLIIVEIGLITPPVGMNLFVIAGMDSSTRLAQTYKYVLPFVLSDIVRTGFLILFPSITLLLVRQFY